MKILYCAEWYYPCVDGVSKVVQKYAEYMEKKGNEVYVVTSKHNMLDENQVLNNVKIKRFGIIGNDVKTIRGHKKDFIDFLINKKFDIIVTYAAQTWHFDILKRINKKDIGNPKLIGFPCGFSGLIGIRKIFYKNYFRLLPKYLMNFDMLVFHSQNYIDYKFVSQFYEGRIEVLPNGVDIKEFNESNQKNILRKILDTFGIDIDKVIILNVGNHMFAKNHKDFIKISHEFPEIQFIQVGRKVDKRYSCYNNCKKETIKSNNFFAIELNREMLVELFKHSWLFLLTSKVEAFPLVLLEAMGSKTPYISYNVGAAKEINGGIIVNNVDGFIKEIKNLCNDDNEYMKICDVAYDKVQSAYTWEKILKHHYTLISNIH